MTQLREYQVVASCSGGASRIQIMTVRPGPIPVSEELFWVWCHPRVAGAKVDLYKGQLDPIAAPLLNAYPDTEVCLAVGDAELFQELVSLAARHWGAPDADSTASDIMDGVSEALAKREAEQAAQNPPNAPVLHVGVYL